MHDNAQPHLSHRILSRVAETASEEDSGLPPLKAEEYVPHARAANAPLFAIHFVGTGGEVRSFQYVHLDSDSSLTPDRICLRFIGLKPVKVNIRGRNLRRLYDYIHQHRMSWVMAASRDFASDGQTLISELQFEDLQEG